MNTKRGPWNPIRLIEYYIVSPEDAGSKCEDLFLEFDILLAEAEMAANNFEKSVKLAKAKKKLKIIEALSEEDEALSPEVTARRQSLIAVESVYQSGIDIDALVYQTLERVEDLIGAFIQKPDAIVKRGHTLAKSLTELDRLGLATEGHHPILNSEVRSAKERVELIVGYARCLGVHSTVVMYERGSYRSQREVLDQLEQEEAHVQGYPAYEAYIKMLKVRVENGPKSFLGLKWPTPKAPIPKIEL